MPPSQWKLIPARLLGTAGYMSPEQVRGQVVDARSDLFSLGVVLYEMVSGKRAFTEDSAIEVMNAILKQEPPELDATLPPSRPMGEENAPYLADIALGGLWGVSISCVSGMVTRLHQLSSQRRI